MISIKFLLIISMLYKTNWSGELRACSGKINLMDTSTNSPHYFYWKHIGTRNEINNNLILGFKGLKSSPPKVVDYEWWLFTRGLNCGALTRKKLVGYLWKMVTHGGLSVLVNLILFYFTHFGVNYTCMQVFTLLGKQINNLIYEENLWISTMKSTPKSRGSCK